MRSALSLRVTFSVVVILLPLTSLGASMDFKEIILNLMEGSTLNFTTEVEVSSLQSIYVCVTNCKSLSITLEDFDLNATLSAGGCVVCDSNDIVQNCTHQFYSSKINVMINQLQNDSESVQFVNFFKENVSVDDDGTKLFCAYEAGNTTVPCSWIYLNVYALPTPENPINILVPVVVSSSTVIALLVILLIMVTTVICVHKHKRRIRISLPKGKLMSLHVATIKDSMYIIMQHHH